MSTCLISKTEGYGDLEGCSLGEILAYVARVSNPSNQLNHETSSKLLLYCLKKRHWSVFEHGHITIEVTTSRAIAAQILRHRSFTFQEFSQRYAEATEFITYPARRQDASNRQSSVDDMSKSDRDWFELVQMQTQRDCQLRYENAIARGIAKEQARFLLPLSTKTVLYVTGNVRSWLTYCQLRCAPETQLEHRELALGCLDIIADLLPELITELASYRSAPMPEVANG